MLILQAFYWNCLDDWWEEIASISEEIAVKGFDTVWLPPPSKGMNGKNSMGYDIKEHYNLNSKFGNRKTLKKLINKNNTSGNKKYSKISSFFLLYHVRGFHHVDVLTSTSPVLTILLFLTRSICLLFNFIEKSFLITLVAFFESFKSLIKSLKSFLIILIISSHFSFKSFSNSKLILVFRLILRLLNILSALDFASKA
jgi:hypothetical protein